MMMANYTFLGFAYHKTRQYKKEKRLYRKVEKVFPVDPCLLYYRQAILSLTEGDTVMVNKYIEKLIAITKEKLSYEADIATGMAFIYSEAGIMGKAEEYYRKALSLEPEKAGRLNNLAYFLIDKDRNVNEGIELDEKALKLQPDNYSYLDCKGWGLFKQSKIKEALEFLEKGDSLKPVYNHNLYLHFQAAKKAIANQKNN